MNTELWIERNQADLTAGIGALITRAINDVRNMAAKDGTFTKTVKLPGTAKNNAIFGHINSPSRGGDYNPALVNVGTNFSPAKPARCVLYSRGMMLLKGVIRLLKISSDGDYECTIYGELGGFASAINSAGNLDNLDGKGLDYSSLNAAWNVTTMNANVTANAGLGLLFPLIDYGNVSTNKVDYQYSARRPAIFVRDYIRKIIAKAGYTVDAPFFDTDFFKRLIVPHNEDLVYKRVNQLLYRKRTSTYRVIEQGVNNSAAITLLTNIETNNFTTVNSGLYTYSGSAAVTVYVSYKVTGWVYDSFGNNDPRIALRVNGSQIAGHDLFYFNDPFSIQNATQIAIVLNPGDTIELFANLQTAVVLDYYYVDIYSAELQVYAIAQQVAPAVYGDTLDMDFCVPKGIKQKDFFLSVCNLFNLYISDDPQDDRKLIIRPYPLYYTGNVIDWTDKVDVTTIEFTPLSELTSKKIAWRFAADDDYFNKLYIARNNRGYGDRVESTGFEFGTDEKEVKVIFAATPIAKKVGTDKAVSVICGGVWDGTEENIKSKIRILYAKEITGVTSWALKDGSTTLQTRTVHPYAGHLDDPGTPTIDLNFAPPAELFYELANPYTSNNLFEAYWKRYIDEIRDQNSSMMTAMVHLSAFDFATLNFANYVWIKGVAWAINKVYDYDTEKNGMTKVELLKVINPF